MLEEIDFKVYSGEPKIVMKSCKGNEDISEKGSELEEED